MTANAGYRHSAEATTPDVLGESAPAPNTRTLETRPIQPALMTLEEAANYLSIGRSRMFELLREGKIPSLTIGPRQRRIRVADIDRYISRRLASEASTIPNR